MEYTCVIFDLGRVSNLSVCNRDIRYSFFVKGREVLNHWLKSDEDSIYYYGTEKLWKHQRNSRFAIKFQIFSFFSLWNSNLPISNRRVSCRISTQSANVVFYTGLKIVFETNSSLRQKSSGISRFLEEKKSLFSRFFTFRSIISFSINRFFVNIIVYSTSSFTLWKNDKNNWFEFLNFSLSQLYVILVVGASFHLFGRTIIFILLGNISTSHKL